MKKLALAVALLQLLAEPVSATTYYVNSKAFNNLGAGTSQATAKKTAAALDALVQPGDVVLVYPGNYAWPNPANAGSSAGYITYKGFSPVGDPMVDSTVRATISFGLGGTEGPGSLNYVSVKGITISNACHWGRDGLRDSVTYCTVLKSLEMYGCDYNVFENNICMGPRIELLSSSGNWNVSNTIRYNHFWQLGYGLTTQNHILHWGAGVDSLTFSRNICRGRLEANATNELSPWICYQLQHSTIDHNSMYWDVRAPQSFVTYALRLRDSSFINTFRADTVYAVGPTTIWFSGATSGTSGSTYRCWQNRWDSCYVDLSQCGGSEVRFYDDMNGDTLTNNVFSTNGYALWVDQIKGQNLIDHNTFIGNAANGVVSISKRTGTNAWGDTAVTFTNNIIYPRAATFTGPLPDAPAGGSKSSCLIVATAGFDSSTSMHGQKKLISNNNLYSYYPGQAYGRGDRDILISNGGAWWSSTPGDSTATNPYGRADNRWRMDSLSVHGSPQFIDTTLTGFMDPHLSFYSAAIGIGTSGTDAGALAYANKPIMSIPNTAITFGPDFADSSHTTVYNTGNGTLTISSIVSASGQYTTNVSSMSIAAGSSQVLSIYFDPFASGARSADIVVSGNDAIHPTITIRCNSTGEGAGSGSGHLTP